MKRRILDSIREFSLPLVGLIMVLVVLLMERLVVWAVVVSMFKLLLHGTMVCVADVTMRLEGRAVVVRGLAAVVWVADVTMRSKGRTVVIG